MSGAVMSRTRILTPKELAKSKKDAIISLKNMNWYLGTGADELNALQSDLSANNVSTGEKILVAGKKTQKLNPPEGLGKEGEDALSKEREKVNKYNINLLNEELFKKDATHHETHDDLNLENLSVAWNQHAQFAKMLVAFSHSSDGKISYDCDYILNIKRVKSANGKEAIVIDSIAYNIKRDIRNNNREIVNTIPIPGTLNARFVLEDKKLKLMWLKSSNDLLKEFCMQNSVEITPQKIQLAYQTEQNEIKENKLLNELFAIYISLINIHYASSHAIKSLLLNSLSLLNECLTDPDNAAAKEALLSNLACLNKEEACQDFCARINAILNAPYVEQAPEITANPPAPHFRDNHPILFSTLKYAGIGALIVLGAAVAIGAAIGVAYAFSVLGPLAAFGGAVLGVLHLAGVISIPASIPVVAGAIGATKTTVKECGSSSSAAMIKQFNSDKKQEAIIAPDGRATNRDIASKRNSNEFHPLKKKSFWEKYFLSIYGCTSKNNAPDESFGERSQQSCWPFKR